MDISSKAEFVLVYSRIFLLFLENKKWAGAANELMVKKGKRAKTLSYWC